MLTDDSPVAMGRLFRDRNFSLPGKIPGQREFFGAGFE